MPQRPGPSAPDPSAAAADTDLAAACAQLQGELDALLEGHDTEAAVASLDTAIASTREVEQHNVSSVQLVALAGR